MSGARVEAVTRASGEGVFLVKSVPLQGEGEGKG